MNIVIVGAGEVGYCLADELSRKNHGVVVIEEGVESALYIDEQLNVLVIQGNGSSAEVLVQAGVASCDYFLSTTADDRTNLVACSLAKALGAKNTVARLHDQSYIDNQIVNYQLHFGVDYLFSPEALCAMEIAKIIRNPDRVMVQNFARGEIEVQGLTVSSGSSYAYKALKDLSLDANVRVGFIHRDNKVIIPEAETTILPLDTVTLFGNAEVLLQEQEKWEGSQKEQALRVVLYGGDETSISLVRLLRNPRFKVRIIEKDLKRCKTLAEKFPQATIINGDGTSRRLLEEEQIGSVDYFVGASRDDEDNVMTCLQAKQLGAKNVILLINKPDYEGILDHIGNSIGIEKFVSPRIASRNDMLRHISDESFVYLSTLPNKIGRILEVRIDSDSQAVGKTVRELDLKGIPIVALLHKFSVKVPLPEDRILAGDRLIVIAPEDKIKSALKVLL